MIKGVNHAHLAPIWYHSAPYSPTQFLGWDSFYRFLQQTRSRTVFGSMKKKQVKSPNVYYCCYCSYWREIIHSVALIRLPEAYGMIREWPSLEGHNPNSTIIIIIILVQPAQSGLLAWAAIVELCGTVVTTHFIRSNNDKLLRDSSASRSLSSACAGFDL